MSLQPYPLQHWTVAVPAPPVFVDSMRARGIDPVVAQVLHGRGHTDHAACDRFLAAESGPLGDPRRLKSMDLALARIARAIATRERIGVYGDFDVDGLTATAVMVETLRHLGSDPVPYLPNRFQDGYGLRLPGIFQLRESGCSLVVAADCGVSAVKEIAVAREHGIDVIVVDHHTVPAILPDCVAVVNPRQPGCDYGFADLAAVGLAYRLAEALLDELPGRVGDRAAVEDRLLELVALGSVADVVPLVAENRVLVARGLRVLNRSPRPGIAAILRRSSTRTVIDADVLGYSVAPRLNAAGRLGEARVSLDILLSDDPIVAEQLAARLDNANRERQRLTEDAVRIARDQVMTRPGAVAFAASPDFSIGVVGLIASRLCEEHSRPGLAVGINGDDSRGSLRTPHSIDAVALLDAARDLLTQYGGHQRAAGFSLPTARLEALRERFEEYLSTTVPAPVRTLNLDGEVVLATVDDDLPRRLAAVGPFGFGNPTPAFVTRGLRLASARAVGRGGPDHAKLRLFDGRRDRDAIGFGMGSAVSHLSALRHGLIDVAYTLDINEWNGTRSVQLRLLDWSPSRA